MRSAKRFLSLLLALLLCLGLAAPVFASGEAEEEQPAEAIVEIPEEEPEAPAEEDGETAEDMEDPAEAVEEPTEDIPAEPDRAPELDGATIFPTTLISYPDAGETIVKGAYLPLSFTLNPGDFSFYRYDVRVYRAGTSTALCRYTETYETRYGELYPTVTHYLDTSGWTAGTYKIYVTSYYTYNGNTYTSPGDLGDYILTFYLTSSIAPLTAGVSLNETNIPDAEFRSYLKRYHDWNGDSVLSSKEIGNIGFINLDQSETEGDYHKYAVRDLTGIKNFVYLKTLVCEDAPLTFLDVGGMTGLGEIYCTGCQLSSVNVQGCTALKILACSKNKNLTALDVSGCSKLEELYCWENALASLNINDCHLLKTLECNGNNLTYLDASPASFMNELWCFDNPLKEIKLPRYLTELSCYNCKLTSLDVSGCRELIELACFDNELKELDVTKNTKLTLLNVHSNSLTTLDVSKNTQLKLLFVHANKIVSQDISNCPTLVSLYNERNIEKLDNGIIYRHYDAASGGYDDGMGLGVNSTASLVLPGGVVAPPYSTPGADAIPIDAAHFPDREFRRNISDYIDDDGDGYLSSSEIDRTEYIWFSYFDDDGNLHTYDVADLTGIRYFTKLIALDCSYTPLRTMDLSGNPGLEELYCDSCLSLTSLDVSKCTKLKILSCHECKLSGLDLRSCGELEYLWCMCNGFTTLDLSNNTKLERLYCSMNNLKTLDVTRNTALKDLSCYDCGLTSLDVSRNTQLEMLSCRNNALTSLDLTANTKLDLLYCYDNRLTQLDIHTCPALREYVRQNRVEIEDGHKGYSVYDENEGGYIWKLAFDQGVTLYADTAAPTKPASAPDAAAILRAVVSGDGTKSPADAAAILKRLP